ncbi:MAG: metal ABC transporter permease [Clostridia bacterium]|nr:metal ABC transporter permease [Clostridia bacterium]
MIASYFQNMPEIMTRAIVVGTLVSLCASLLGVTLVLKRYSMIGDGLSHVGFGALAIATVLHVGKASMAVSLPIVMLAAFMLMWLTEKRRMQGDAAIAVLSTGAIAVGTLLFRFSDNQYQDICNSLFGTASMALLSDTDMWITVGVSVAVIMLFILFYTRIFSVTFDTNFAKATGVHVGAYSMMLAALTAVTVVIGMKMVGAIMVSGLIIFPALSAMRVAKRFRSVMITSAALSLFCFFAGFFLSLLIEAQPGPAIIAVHVLSFLVCSFIGALKTRIRARKTRSIVVEPPCKAER